MWLISKYKIVSIFLLFLVLVSCSKPYTNMQFKGYKTRSVISKVPVIRDDSLAQYNDSGIYGDTKIYGIDLNSRVPVYIVTGSFNSLSSIYGQILCDSLNNDFSNNKYLCIIQSQKEINKSSQFFRKDDLTIDPEATYVADFLITRTDYLLEKQKNNSGPLKDFPTLDVVMFLNGSYLYLWGDNNFNAVEFSQFVTNFNAKYPKANIKIAISNSLAKDLITKVILSNAWAANFEFITLNEESLTNKSRNYNIIAYAGPSISKKLIDYINVYNKNFIPLSLSDNIIFNIQKANPEISNADIAQYFTANDLKNVIKLNPNLESINEEVNDNKSNNFGDIGEKVHKNSQKNINLPFISGVRYCTDYDKYIFGKSKFNFNVKPINDILSIDKVINISNVKINGIGIRNVLVSTRSTDPILVFSLLSAFLTKHDLIKVNFATPDMKSYNINNLLLGNLYNNQLIYHYGVLNFTNYATNYSNNRLWDKEAEISGIINKFLDDKNAPPFYGPNMPNGSQINTINNQVHQRIIINKQEKVLENFKSIIDTIKEEMKKTDKKDANENKIEEKNANKAFTQNEAKKDSFSNIKNEDIKEVLDVNNLDDIDILKLLN